MIVVALVLLSQLEVDTPYWLIAIVIFLADHPVTGGYPVIAVVVPEDLPRAAQLPPGVSVRFTIIDSPRPANAPQTSGESA